MYHIRRAARFKRDYKRVVRRPDFTETTLRNVLSLLAAGARLPARYKDHPLQGEFIGCRECHLAFDLLLMYQVDHEEHVLCLLRIGSHGDLF